MIENQRHLFDIPADVAYLNCAYMSPLMHSVVEAGHKAIQSKAQPWTVTVPDFFSGPDAFRRQSAQLMGVDAADIAIMPAVSYATATAALNLTLDPGSEILVLKDDFPSDIYVWQRMAADQSLSVVMLDWPANNSCDWTEAILSRIGTNTGLISVPHIHWTNGTIIDLKEVSEAAKSVGAILVLDLTQSLGAMPIDFKEIDPDFAVAATYKWLLGPYGLAAGYVAPRHQKGRPLEEGWIARERSDDFANLVDYQDAYRPGACRFDMGERSQFQLMPMANAGLTQILDWGVAEIAATLRRYTDQLATELTALGLSVPPAELRGPHYLGPSFPGGPPAGILEALAKANIFVSMRGNAMRISPHLYNTQNDADRLISTIKACL